MHESSQFYLQIYLINFISKFTSVLSPNMQHFYGWCYMQGTPATLYAGYAQIRISYSTLQYGTREFSFGVKTFFFFTIVLLSLPLLRTGTSTPARPPAPRRGSLTPAPRNLSDSDSADSVRLGAGPLHHSRNAQAPMRVCTRPHLLARCA